MQAGIDNLKTETSPLPPPIKISPFLPSKSFSSLGMSYSNS